MKWLRIGKAAFCIAAVLSFLEMFHCLSMGISLIYADLINVAEENITDILEDSEDIPDDIYDKDIEVFMQEYLQKIESGEITAKDFSTEMIADPELQMEKTAIGRIRYILPDGSSYESNIPHGMITAQAAEFVLPQGVIGTVTKNGDSFICSGTVRISEPGEYNLKMIFIHTAASENQTYGIYEVNHSFTVIPRSTGAYKEIYAPEGFTVSSAKKDGVRQDITDQDCVRLNGDGNYEILFVDTDSKTITISLDFTQDTTAPFLEFSEEISEGAVSGPVEFTPSEAGTTVFVTYNGSREKARTTVLTVPGNYRLEVSDEAGNTQSYEIQIRQTLKLFDIRLVIMTLIFLVGMVGRLIYLRRNMKVL